MYIKLEKLLILLAVVFCSWVFLRAQEKRTDSLLKVKEIQAVNLTKKVIEQVGDKTYFNVENSNLSKGNNGIEILQKSPKLSVNSDGNILLKNKNATILVNGRKTNLSGADLTAYLQSLSSEDIKRIEIQDVASADQDASITGGIVNIVLKRNPKGLRAIAKTSYTFKKVNYDTYSSSLNLNYGSEKWNMYSDISYAENRDLGNSWGIFNYNNGQINRNGGIFKQSNDNFGFRLGTVFFPNDKNSVGIEGYYNKRNVFYDDIIDLIIYSPNSPTIVSKNYSLSKSPLDLWYFTINYTLKTDNLGSTIKFIGDLGRNNSEPFNDVASVYPSNPLQNSHYLFNTNSVSKYYTAQTDWMQKFNNDWELDAGAKFGSIKRLNLLNVNYFSNQIWVDDFNQKQDFDNRENIFAVYTTLSKTLGKHSLKVGLRLENTNIKGLNNINGKEVSQNYTKLFPNLYYQYDLGNEKNISLNYRRSITRPSFGDLNPFVIKQNDFLYQIGNPNLQPEYGDRIEFGLNLKKHSISLSGSKTQNTIQGNYYTNQNINYFQPLNLGTDYQVSLDYSFSGKLNKWLFANISSGVFHNSFQYNNMTIKGNSFYNNIFGQVSLSKTLIFEISNEFSTPFTYRNVNNALWYKMNLTLQKTFMDGNAMVRLKLNDVFNTARDKNTTIQDNFTFDFYQKRITRNISLILQYNIDNKHKMKSETVQSENESRNRL